MKENFPNLVREIDMQIQEAQRVPNKMHAKRPTPSASELKCQRLQIKRDLRSSKRKAVNYLQGSSHKAVS